MESWSWILLMKQAGTMVHNDFIATRNCRKNWVATWKCILSKRPNQYCLFYDYKRCVSSNLSIISPRISISISNKYTNDWKIGWYTPLKIIKQAILVWSFRQNTFPGCYPVFPAIFSGDEVIVDKRQKFEIEIVQLWCVYCDSVAGIWWDDGSEYKTWW